MLETHYDEFRNRTFFPSLVAYMSSSPVVPMVWEGLNVVKISNFMKGATKAEEASPGTIRGDFSIEVGQNVVHCSASVEEGNREISLWFDVIENNFKLNEKKSTFQFIFRKMNLWTGRLQSAI